MTQVYACSEQEQQEKRSLAVPYPALPATEPEVLEKIYEVQAKTSKLEQIPLKTEHVLHAGMYSRTITMPPYSYVVGALVKIPTLVITVGSAKVLVGREWADVAGFQVLPASANRKQIFISKGPFIVTMVFPTSAKTVEEAEAEFTSEAELLLSRRQEDMNTVVITGE